MRTPDNSQYQEMDVHPSVWIYYDNKSRRSGVHGETHYLPMTYVHGNHSFAEPPALPQGHEVLDVTAPLATFLGNIGAERCLFSFCETYAESPGSSTRRVLTTDIGSVPRTRCRQRQASRRFDTETAILQSLSGTNTRARTQQWQ